MPVTALTALDFDNSPFIQWFGAHDQLGDPANTAVDAYANAHSGVSVTVSHTDPPNALRISMSPAGLNCNLESNTGLLLATNSVLHPLQIDFSQPVQSVGAFIIGQAPFGRAFLAHMSVLLNGAGAWVNLAPAVPGTTSPMVTVPTDLPAPFVGLRAPAGDSITAVRFGAQAQDGNMGLRPMGIGHLYFWV